MNSEKKRSEPKRPEIKKKESVTSCDLLIAGSGLAGMRAAFDALDAGLKVLWITDGRLCSGSSFYPLTGALGSQAADSKEDEEVYLQEVLETGCTVCDPELTKAVITDIPEMIERMPEIGIHPGRMIANRPACFAKRERLLYTWTGWDRIREEAREIFSGKKDLELREHTELTRLFVKDGKIAGALCIGDADELEFVSTSAVLLATGGYCGLYKHSLNTAETTGTGHSMALDAGAELVNMEFMQFIPGFIRPVYKLLFSETTLRHAVSVRNADGEDSLKKILPENVSFRDCLEDRAMHGPFTTEDRSRYFEQAMMQDAKVHHRDCGFEIAFDPAIATDSNGFIVGARKMYEPRGIDLSKDKIWLAPFAHCANGGIRINAKAQTAVPGLFAAGETAGGIHGADRHGGMATSAALVFGRRAALAAAEYVRGKQPASEEERTADAGDAFRAFEDWIGAKPASDRPADPPADGRLPEVKGGMTVPADSRAPEPAGRAPEPPGDRKQRENDPQEILEELGEQLWYRAGCERDGKELEELRSRILEMGKEFSVAAAVAAGNSLKKSMRAFHGLRTARALTEAMLARKESRGPHFRKDCPGKQKALDGVRFAVTEKNSEIAVK